MSTEKRSVYLSELAPVMQEVLHSGGTFILTVTGMSMFPTLYGGRDRVRLIRPPERLSKYDLPLYRRKDGSYVLHRIVAVGKDGRYTCCGDNQTRLERGLQHTQMIGLVSQIERNGKLFSVTKRGYRRYVRFWVRMRVFRPVLLHIYRFCAKIGRRLSGKTPTKEGTKRNETNES